MYIALGVLVVLVILYFSGNKSVHHEIQINASPQKVWTVLMDTDSYDAWNPVMRLLEGEVKEGNKVKYQFTQAADNKYDIETNVKRVQTNKLLNQGGGIPMILTFNHQYILESAIGGTKLIIHEDYNGIGVNFWNPKPVQSAYERLNEAIKKQAESI